MLSLCLDRLAPGTQTLAADSYEVIVTDDGKNNEAKKLIEDHYPWAHWMEGPKCGPAANRNNGARLATCEWLVFTDDDCLPDPGWLMAYTKAFDASPGCKAFEGAILPDDWNLLKKDMAECPINTKGGAFWSANIMVEKNAFWNVGGFDEQLRMAAQEDQDLEKKISTITTIKFLPNAKIIHPVRISEYKLAITRIPKGIKNWYTYSRKYYTVFSTIRMGIKSQVLAIASNILKARIRSATVNVATLFCLIPVILLNEYKKVK